MEHLCGIWDGDEQTFLCNTGILLLLYGRWNLQPPQIIQYTYQQKNYAT
ncbi:MAG: hypothetical protein HYX39_04300 [Bacteroidetes bacterium]|nr:hypothetical protein [Bacteroidota bacterium]